MTSKTNLPIVATIEESPDNAPFILLEMTETQTHWAVLVDAEGEVVEVVEAGTADAAIDFLIECCPEIAA